MLKTVSNIEKNEGGCLQEWAESVQNIMWFRQSMLKHFHEREFGHLSNSGMVYAKSDGARPARLTFWEFGS